jgi:hypothetical protein
MLRRSRESGRWGKHARIRLMRRLETLFLRADHSIYRASLTLRIRRTWNERRRKRSRLVGSRVRKRTEDGGHTVSLVINGYMDTVKAGGIKRRRSFKRVKVPVGIGNGQMRLCPKIRLLRGKGIKGLTVRRNRRNTFQRRRQRR